MALLALLVTFSGGCDLLEGGLNADSSCQEFNEATIQEQQEAVTNIAQEVDDDLNQLELANSMLNVEFLCGQNPDLRLGDAVSESVI